MKNYNKISRKLSFILRHDPEAFNIEMDNNGWCLIKDVLLKGKLNISSNILFDIVNLDNKNRYEISLNNKKIRARQGHSYKRVNIDYKVMKNPPDIFYHGTSIKNLSDIMLSGELKSMSRHYVHLSLDIETAKKVGSRHGKVVIIEIDTHKLDDTIYFSDNNVVLIKKVPKTAFKNIIYNL